MNGVGCGVLKNNTVSRMVNSNVAKGHDASSLLDICFRRNAATPSDLEIKSLLATVHRYRIATSCCCPISVLNCQTVPQYYDEGADVFFTGFKATPQQDVPSKDYYQNRRRLLLQGRALVAAISNWVAVIKKGECFCRRKMEAAEERP